MVDIAADAYRGLSDNHSTSNNTILLLPLSRVTEGAGADRSDGHVIYFCHLVLPEGQGSDPRKASGKASVASVSPAIGRAMLNANKMLL